MPSPDNAPSGNGRIPRCDGFNGVGCDRLATTRRGLCARCDTERLLMVTRRLAGLPSPPADLVPVRVVRFPRSFVRDDGDAAA